MAHRAAPVLVVVALFAAACASGTPARSAAPVHQAPNVQVAGIVGRSGSTATAGVRPRDPRRDGIRRALFVGDSLTFGAYQQLTLVLAAHHVESRFVGFAGTGLLSGQGWWRREMGVQLDAFHPDVVVVEACCNYGNGEPDYVGADGVAVAADTPAMYRAWEAEARAIVKRARSAGATVHWVVTPEGSILVSDRFRGRIAGFNRISARLGVPRIDWRRALEPNGIYTTGLIEGDRLIAVRKPDGLHLTPDGAMVVAAYTWRAIAGDF